MERCFFFCVGVFFFLSAGVFLSDGVCLFLSLSARVFLMSTGSQQDIFFFKRWWCMVFSGLEMTCFQLVINKLMDFFQSFAHWKGSKDARRVPPLDGNGDSLSEVGSGCCLMLGFLYPSA